jgi:heme-degrading monooxygenase HmoA
MVILAHVKHFLTAEGIQNFPQWLVNTGEILKRQPGFISMKSALDPEDITCVNLWIEFKNLAQIKQWTNTEFHTQVVSALDPYRLKPFKSILYDLNSNIST